ncbi:uncharacterized protein LOC126555777 [Aphis gossypii]|uniref:uncharacterized protein LOC126555777 n=1 Tax=Aphis gossypii TaxID=80765 RepID=UPI0021594248|nr:uncharacterized protein LOC126555777 [Aphis gossypii]
MENNESSVARVAVKIPEFISSDPELWFAMVEGSFASAGIKIDSTKFGYVVGALPPKYAVEVKDIIMAPPSENRYVKIKQELVKRLSASQEEKTRQLLERVEMGDRKPSQFLRHLQSLADTSIPETLLKTLWMGRLPKSIQVALAIVKDCKLEDLAAHADNMQTRLVLCYLRSRNQVSNTLEATLNLKLSQLALGINQEITALRKEIAEINTRPARGRSPDPSAHRSRSRSRSRNSHGVNGMLLVSLAFWNPRNV